MAIALARQLTRWRIQPNIISVASLAFALTGALAMLAVAAGGPAGQRAALLVAAALCIQLRLLCNLLDGMVAVEGGLGTSTGAVFNELPDRLADPLLIVPVGYLTGVAWGPELAWSAGLLALLTANIRLLGASLGLPQDFQGPMAKPHRMAALTLGLLIAALCTPLSLEGPILFVTLIALLIGTGLTAVRRTRTLLRDLGSP
ncbi:MAG: CDP-alcohol phosphatidyltransferase family protein [Chromatiales bacterium]|nr:CDP-alcohol phosphatidyltransferase family protein [Chromatiales bacterium]